MRVIKVQGKGKISTPPDTVIISFDIQSISKDYEKCIGDINKRTEALRSEIEKAGRGRTDLKTSDFSISVQTKYTGEKRVFDGYKGRHTLHIEVASNKELFNNVLKHVSQGYSGAEINLTFTVKDKKALEEATLVEAVRSAKRNASILAEAADLKLGNIQQVDYGWTEVRIYNQKADMVCDSISPSAPDIEPENVGAEDVVTLVYEILD